MNLFQTIAKLILKVELEEKDNLINEYSTKIKELDSKIIDLNDQIEDLLFPNPKEIYYNNKYPKQVRYYNKKFLNKIMSLDVRCFVGNYNNDKLPTFKSKDDKLALAGLKWVVDNLTYKSDSQTSGMDEYWNFSFETLDRRVGDCEDGAILLYDILRKNGIPAWKLRLTAGYVVNPYDGQIGGHAYLTYYSEEFDKWVALDWCYLPNLEEMKEQPHYKDVSMYGDVWFSFNENHSWGKDKIQ